MIHRKAGSYGRSRSAVIGGVVLGAVILAIAAYFAYTALFEGGGDYAADRGEMTEGFGQLATIEYGGTVYVEKKPLTKVLLIGVDREGDGERTLYRDGGQADYLMLVVIDPTSKQVRRLEIDRDTIAEVTVLGIFGNEVGTRQMQICLSHGYGAEESVSCAYTVRSVSNLLQGLEIDNCMSLRMGAIGRLNSLLGGVTVTLEHDLTGEDPALEKGATVCLSDEQAVIFVRSRMTVGSGTNRERMARQRLYMEAVSERFRELAGGDASFANKLVTNLDDLLYTDMNRGKLANELGKAAKYDILPVESLTGEHMIGSNGYMEFHVDEESIIQWVLSACYEPK